MNYDDYPPPIRRSPRAAHELKQAFEQLQLENTGISHNDDEDEYSDSDNDFPPPIPPRRVDSYNRLPATNPREPPSHSSAHLSPLSSHPIDVPELPTDHTTAPALVQPPKRKPGQQYRFSHPFREQLCAPRLPDPVPRRHPTNLVSYKPVNQRLHPQLRKRTSLDTIASVTTTASARDADVDEPSDMETPSPSMFTLESESHITPDANLGPPFTGESPKPSSSPESLRTASVDSIPSMPPTTPVSSAETLPSKGILRKLKPGKRKFSVGTDRGVDRLVIERTVSVDQTSYRSNSSGASNTISSGTPPQYPTSETGNSRSSSTWTASSHDISGLTPEELKKCKKKGINPSLFAEMKAARKGKWTSPIAGNTFLA